MQYSTAAFSVFPITFCSGTCLDFMDSSLRGDTYLWNFPGGTPSTSTDKNPTHICFDTAGSYFVMLTVSNAFGSDTSGMLITVDKCSEIYVPNAFSPNGDGKNDIFYALGKGISSLHMMIFNRWGEKIFETNSSDKELGWHGDYKGVPQPLGVYVYLMFATMTNGTVIEKKGNVTLIR